MNPDRYFDPDPTRRAIARELYDSVAALPLICPHGHVDPRLFADPAYSFGSPVDLLIIPDHYVFRMLYSQGITLESLGIPSLPSAGVRAETITARSGRPLPITSICFAAHRPGCGSTTN